MKVFVKILEICVIIDLEIDSYINRLCEKVVDYYDTCTIRKFVRTIRTLNILSV